LLAGSKIALPGWENQDYVSSSEHTNDSLTQVHPGRQISVVI